MLNNKGFAITTILYSLLLMATLILALLLGSYSFERRSTDDFNQSIKDELSSYDGKDAESDLSGNISVRKVTGGNLNISASKYTVGSTINFEPVADSGFSYKGAVIKNADTGEIVSNLNENIRSFTMPSFKFIISPTWKYNDKYVFYVDISSDGQWTYQYTDGAVSHFLWDSTRHYITVGIHTTDNSRRAMWTEKTYDLTHYKTYQAMAYEYTVHSGYSVNNYHNTMWAGVSKTDKWVSWCSNKVQRNGAGDRVAVYFDVDVSGLTGAYYLGFEVLSNSHPQSVNFVQAVLIGNTYS